MSQDAEAGPRFSGDAPGERPPMNQEVFDDTFYYHVPEQKGGRLETAKQKVVSYLLKRRNQSTFKKSFLSFFPIIEWLPNYSPKENLLSDALGGITVGVMNVPQGIAYAHLAGVDPVIGLYISFFPPLIYMIFGTSRHASIGSFAVVSLMSGLACQELLAKRRHESEHPEEFDLFNGTNTDSLTMNEAASALTVTVGFAMILMAILRLEFVATYFSDQMVAGFTTAASVHLMFGQFKEIFSIKNPHKDRADTGYIFFMIYDIASNLQHVNLANIAIAAISIVFLIATKEYLNDIVNKKFKKNFSLPCDLVLVMVATSISYVWDFENRFHIKIIGHIPTGLPTPKMPHVELMPDLFVDALGIAVVVIAVHISLAKIFAKKAHYKIDSGQAHFRNSTPFWKEFYAMGLTSLISGIFPVYPVACSLGRTMVNVESGTKTQLSSVFSSLLLFTLIFRLGPLLQPLPLCVLSAIVIVSLKGIMKKFMELPELWPISKIDFLIWVVSFTATLCIDVMTGLAISICFALFTTVYRQQWPRWHFLGNLRDTNDFRDAERYLDVQFDQDICIFRFDSPLLFTNVELFKSSIHKANAIWKFKQTDLDDEKDVKKEAGPFCQLDAAAPRLCRTGSIGNLNLERTIEIAPPIRKARSTVFKDNEKWLERISNHFIIDCSGFTFVDCMGVNAIKEMRSNGVLVYFAAAKAPVRDLFEASDFYRFVPKSNFYPTINDAVLIAKRRRKSFKRDDEEKAAVLEHDLMAEVLSSQPLN